MSEGASAFYTGPIAERLAAAMSQNGGLITMEDLAAYEAKERDPVRGTYRDYEIISMPPPSSGGTILVEMLNILETFDMSQYEASDPAAIHLLVEAMRQGYLDRATYLGDADFVDVPIDRLTSKEYGQQVAAGIDPTHARLGLRRDHALLGGRCLGKCRINDLHHRGRIWLPSHGRRHWVPAEQ